MNRRGFIAALAALPFVGGLAKPDRRIRLLPAGMRVLNVDGSMPETAVPDRYCPLGQAVVCNRILMVNPKDVRSTWGRPDAVIGINGAWFHGWRLT